MNYQTYQQIRAYCYQDLQGYIDTPENAVLEMNIKLAGGREGIARIKHEQDAAHDLFRCLDLTPRENAAARLLAVISNHRAITWQREPRPPSGKKPAPPLEKSMADALAKQTSDAVKKYAAFLPEPERAVLIADCEAALTAAPAKGEAVAGTTPAPAEVEAVKRGITKQQVINAFEGLHFDSDKWGKYLADINSAPWLKDCRVTPGVQGSRTSATWNPVLIAAALIDKGINIRKLDAVFVRLKDWADEWREISASFRD